MDKMTYQRDHADRAATEGASREHGTYTGTRVPEISVEFDDGNQATPLPLRQDLYDHSESFEWGYEGSGPAQLALAILAHLTGDDDLALRVHQEFKIEYIARIPQSTERQRKNARLGRSPEQGWALDAIEVADWIRKVESNPPDPC